VQKLSLYRNKSINFITVRVTVISETFKLRTVFFSQNVIVILIYVTFNFFNFYFLCISLLLIFLLLLKFTVLLWSLRSYCRLIGALRIFLDDYDDKQKYNNQRRNKFLTQQ